MEAEASDDNRTIIVTGASEGYVASNSVTATKTDTPLIDIPQTISVMTREQLEDQAHHSLADVLRYVPGTTVGQGEGNRDAIILRGNSSTSDFFLDGVRDDVEYYRDFYNVDRVEILYTHFVNAVVRKVINETFLPIGEVASGNPGAGASSAGSALFEPDAETIFAELLPRYATAKLYASLADSLASEHSARMVAMGSARKNAGELVDSLTLTRNRLRQAMITREISELVGGAEALK